MEENKKNNSEKNIEPLKIPELNRSERRKTLMGFSLLLMLIMFLTSLSTCCYTKSRSVTEIRLRNDLALVNEDLKQWQLKYDSLKKILKSSHSSIEQMDTLLFESLKSGLGFMEKYRSLNQAIYTDNKVDFRKDLADNEPEYRSLLNELLPEDKIQELINESQRITSSCSDIQQEFNNKIKQLYDELKDLEKDKRELKDDKNELREQLNNCCANC